MRGGGKTRLFATCGGDGVWAYNACVSSRGREMRVGGFFFFFFFCMSCTELKVAGDDRDAEGASRSLAEKFGLVKGPCCGPATLHARGAILRA